MDDAKRKKAAWVGVAIAAIGGFEGLRTVAYLDPVSIPTACFGETLGVEMGQVYTVEQCKEMLGNRLEEFGRGVDSCTKVALPPYRKAALVSFAYNVGVANYCQSTLVRKLNAGDTVGACNELSKWTKARGITLPGLVTRREQERLMCMRELT